MEFHFHLPVCYFQRLNADPAVIDDPLESDLPYPLSIALLLGDDDVVDPCVTARYVFADGVPTYKQDVTRLAEQVPVALPLHRHTRWVDAGKKGGLVNLFEPDGHD